MSSQPDAQPEIAISSHEERQPLMLDWSALQDFEPAQVVVEPVEPVDGLFARFGGRCLALRGVLSPEECRYLIEHMSSQGPLESVRYRQDYRRNDRTVFESFELADLLWKRVQPVAEKLAVLVDNDPASQRLDSDEGDYENSEACPAQLHVGYGCEGLWIPAGLNECLRFCRYNPGGFFRAHCDGRFRRNDDEMSLFTCMFYLDGKEAMEGGATRFLKMDMQLPQDTYLQPAPEEEVLASLQPEQGMCLLFFQNGFLHEGEELRKGVKHILRTEVMFRRDVSSKPVRTNVQEEAWRLAQRASELCDTEPGKACELWARAFKLDPHLEKLF